MSGYGLMEQLTSLIRIVMDYPQGLSILLGTVPPPGSGEINEMLNSIRRPAEPLRVDGGHDFSPQDAWIDSAEMFGGIIERAGGWEKINEVTRIWTANYPLQWRVLAEYVAWVKPNTSRADGSMIEKISQKHGVSRSYIYSAAQEFPQRLATAVLNWVPEKPGQN